jgi:ATP-dependent DNA helicase 2 subunit 2
LIVALNAQSKFLGTKKSWTRKVIVVTDGENYIETADYKQTVENMNANEVMTSVV